MKTLKDFLMPLAVVAVVAGVVGLSYIFAKKEAEIIKENGGKTMPSIQPWITVYDNDGDGEPDKTMVGILGGPAGQYKLIYDRKPTQKEINWYKNKE